MQLFHQIEVCTKYKVFSRKSSCKSFRSVIGKIMGSLHCLQNVRVKCIKYQYNPNIWFSWILKHCKDLKIAIKRLSAWVIWKRDKRNHFSYTLYDYYVHKHYMCIADPNSHLQIFPWLLLLSIIYQKEKQHCSRNYHSEMVSVEWFSGKGVLGYCKEWQPLFYAPHSPFL